MRIFAHPNKDNKYMKHAVIIYIGICCAAACTPAAPSLEAGDLLFVAGGGSAMNDAIRSATASQGSLPYTHVGMLTEGADSVIEATSPEGVRIVPLAAYLDRAAHIGDRPCVTVKRYPDAAAARAAVRRARSLVGAPYDHYFRSGNDRYYCSELVWECYRDADDRPIFPTLPMRFRDDAGEMPAYWIEHFAALGEPIPEAEPGTNPAAMAEDERLTEIPHRF